MNCNENTVLVVKNYDKIDGYNAYVSQIKCLSLGVEPQEDRQRTRINAKVWKESEKEGMTELAELELHQVLDLAIFSCQSLEYFQEAYRFPKLYDPENPCVERIGLQGNVMPVTICTDNEMLDSDIEGLSLAVNRQGDMIGERLRVLSRLLEEMGY